MERPLAFFDGREELLPQRVDIGVVGEFKIVDTCHDAGEIIVRRVWSLAWLADYREHRGQALETYLSNLVSLLLCSN